MYQILRDGHISADLRIRANFTLIEEHVEVGQLLDITDMASRNHIISMQLPAQPTLQTKDENHLVLSFIEEQYRQF